MLERQLIYPIMGAGHLVQSILYLNSTIDPEYSLSDKLSYIIDEVYGPDKRWFNWVTQERYFKYKATIEKRNLISNNHFLTPSNLAKAKKTLVIDYNDFTPLYERSFIYSPSMWARQSGYPYSLENIFTWWKEAIAESEESESVRIILGNPLFSKTPDLDKDLYNEIIGFFEFEDHYTEANLVYKRWMQCMDAATLEFSNVETDDDFSSVLHRTGKRLKCIE